MESLRIFHNFKLDNLDESWITSVWDTQFVIYDESPDHDLDFLESDDVRSLLHESYLILKAWITANCNQCNQEQSKFSWQALMVLDINMRGLLAALGYIMKSGQSAGSDEASRQACMEASSLYLLFLTVPGSNAFRVYHPNLYQKAIETLKLSENLFFPITKESKTTDTTDCDIDEESLSQSEKLKLVNELNSIISNLIIMLKSFWFKDHTESLDVTIRVLLDITGLQMYVKLYNNNGKITNGITSLSHNAFTALEELCNSNHGTVALTITLIAQYMLPYLLFHHINTQPKSITIVHEAAICFLKNLLNTHGKDSARGIVTLIQHLMIKCPERSEGRHKQATVIIQLLNICNKDVIITAFKDIILFSYNCKIPYRLFAQEIVGKLLLDCSLTNDLNTDTRMTMRKILIAVVLTRCMDRSSLVRGKAMATFALFSDCNYNADKILLQNIFESSCSNKAFPIFEDLERSLSQDTDPLPGSEMLITMLLDRVNDERALVRRSALRILRNLSSLVPSLVSRITCVISDRCRDPALIVRQFAVHVFSEILEEFPHNSKLLDEWIQAVIPQIYDIETKVQEKVLECLESVLINRVTNASIYISDAANSLPWRILDKLSTMRMRKHLSKACSLWVKSGVITKSVISNLQSHVGTDNMIGAWILLAALAENMKIPNIDRYITDYKEIIKKNDFHASLVLHVLKHTWTVLDDNCLEDLYQYLYKSMYQIEINFNLISTCLDILSGVLRYLHVDKSDRLIESNMTKLMKVAETEIKKILKEKENCTHDALNYMRAIFTLGHASLLCTKKISSSTLRILEKLLLEWESLPKAIKEIKDLPASIVIFFCQQALRDREIAREVTPILGNLMRQEINSNQLMKTAVKINAAKALADICIRFTALVEPYLPDMCISMKDSNPTVREAIVVIFIQLLLEDFIKVKGPFFFHILTMLSDDDNMIRELTTFLVEERLLVKNKTLISQQFLESIYHYNNYRSRNTFRGYKMHDKEKEILTLPGKVNQHKRNVIYEFMLEHLDPLAKCKLIVKLTKYILHEICDDSIDVTTEKGASVLKDTLFIMSNNRLQLSSFVEKCKDDISEPDEAANASISSISNNNMINAIVAEIKKHNLDNLLPTLITLKKKLISLKSPLSNDVEKLLFKTYTEYEKDYLTSLLNEYPELEKEMDHYQRKLKEKSISESYDATNTVSPIINNKDSLLEMCKQTTPKVLLHRLTPSTILNQKNCIHSYKKDSQGIASHNTLNIKSSSFLNRSLELESTLDTSLSTSTLSPIRNFCPDFNESLETYNQTTPKSLLHHFSSISNYENCNSVCNNDLPMEASDNRLSTKLSLNVEKSPEIKSFLKSDCNNSPIISNLTLKSSSSDSPIRTSGIKRSCSRKISSGSPQCKALKRSTTCLEL